VDAEAASSFVPPVEEGAARNEWISSVQPGDLE
jgi:hypothetical protein